MDDTTGFDMPMTSKISPVEGGWVKRDERTGRFIEVHTSSGTRKASALSETAVKEASAKRSSALKRLSDR